MLGTLGAVAGLGGALIPGAQWLTPLGTGLGALNSAINGDPTAAVGVLGEIAQNGLGGWMNPARGSIAKSEEEQAKELWRKWGGYTGDYFGGGRSCVRW